jgi:hypothetical protein
MNAFKNTSFNERLDAAAKAKKAALEKFRDKPGLDDPAVVARQAERQALNAARETRHAERAAAREAEAQRQAAEAAVREAEAIRAAARRDAAELLDRTRSGVQALLEELSRQLDAGVDETRAEPSFAAPDVIFRGERVPSATFD